LTDVLVNINLATRAPCHNKLSLLVTMIRVSQNLLRMIK